jgi:hypothetical protein
LEARLSEGHGRVLRAEDWTPWGEHRLKVEQQLCGMQGREHCVWRVACVDAVCKSPYGKVLFMVEKDRLFSCPRHKLNLEQIPQKGVEKENSGL